MELKQGLNNIIQPKNLLLFLNAAIIPIGNPTKPKQSNTQTLKKIRYENVCLPYLHASTCVNPPLSDN